MSTLNENTNASETPIFEPFPETNTMPSGWDVSGLAIDPAPASTLPAGDPPAAETN
jgi:hypothetical protein